MLFADFLRDQFDVQTMAEYGWFFGRQATDDTKKNESGTYALHTLGEDETIARLATGIKRFELPDEFNFIKIYQQVAGEAKGWRGRPGRLAEHLREPPAVSRGRRVLAEGNRGEPRPAATEQLQQRLDQIVGNWGRFEPS